VGPEPLDDDGFRAESKKRPGAESAASLDGRPPTLSVQVDLLTACQLRSVGVTTYTAPASLRGDYVVPITQEAFDRYPPTVSGDTVVLAPTTEGVTLSCLNLTCEEEGPSGGSFESVPEGIDALKIRVDTDGPLPSPRWARTSTSWS
jgi:hypothetical protein